MKTENKIVLTIGPITRDGFRVSMRNTCDDDPVARVNNNPETVEGYMELEEMQKILNTIRGFLEDSYDGVLKGVEVHLSPSSEYPSMEV